MQLKSEQKAAASCFDTVDSIWAQLHHLAASPPTLPPAQLVSKPSVKGLWRCHDGPSRAASRQSSLAQPAKAQPRSAGPGQKSPRNRALGGGERGLHGVSYARGQVCGPKGLVWAPEEAGAFGRAGGSRGGGSPAWASRPIGSICLRLNITPGGLFAPADAKVLPASYFGAPLSQRVCLSERPVLFAAEPSRAAPKRAYLPPPSGA